MYQVEPYLRNCLDSILAQNFSDWELIIIDDGSTDGSSEICDGYASIDSRVRVIHQENAGLSAARNIGLDNMRGEYVTMLDADDIFMYPNYLETHLNAVIDSNAQMSICGMLFSREEIMISKESIDSKVLSVVSGRELSAMIELPASCAYGHAGTKLYKSDLFDHIRFPVGRLVEDYAIAHRVIFQCDRIAVLDTPMYGYRIRPGSILRSSKKDRLRQDVILAFQDRIDYFNNMNCPELADVAQQLMLIHLSYYK